MKKTVIFFLLGGLGACTMAMQPQELVGMNKSVVRRRLGQPVIQRTEYPNQVWSYRKNDCSVLVFFNETDNVQYVDVRCPKIKDKQ